MEKLPMCRICLAENVRMYVVVNKNLHELYERLTHIPFVTKDSRPILACYLCCAELKRSFRLLERCLQAEELFAQIMNGNYKQNPLINQDHFRFPHGFIISPIQSINIVEVGLTESVVVKEELPAVCERQDILEPKEEYQGDDLDISLLDVGDILPHDSESDSKNDVLVMEYKIEEEEEQEAFKEECRAVDTNRLTMAEEPKLHLRRSKSEDLIPADQKTNQISVSTVIRSTQNRTSKAERKKLYECDVCLRSFNTNHNLIRHYRIHTGEKPYKCDICQHSSNDKSALRRHIRIHTDEKGYKCDICQIVFRRKPALRVHVRGTHTGSTVAKKPHLRRSKSEDSIPADYKCEKCQSSFTDESSFVHHMCTGKKLFKCNILLCNSSFYKNIHLVKHIRIHTGEKPYKCNKCQRSFAQKVTLAHHIRTRTCEKPYKCEICQRRFPQKFSLAYHIRTHTGEKPYKCDLSQKSFISKFNLTNKAEYKKPHELVKHTGEKPYKCEICQRSFTNVCSFRYHMRTHNGVKPFKCDMCQKSFIKNIYLTHHKRTHTGEKPYKCDVCQRSFAQKVSLTRHSCTPTSEKPYNYKCDICPSSFRRQGNLIRHIRTHTDEKRDKESPLLRGLLSNSGHSICHEGGQKIQLN